MINEIEKVLIDTEELNEIVSRIAHEIDIDYAGEDRKLVLVCILKGSVVFMGDLMKKLTIPVEIDFMRVSSYGGETVSSWSCQHNSRPDERRPCKMRPYCYRRYH